METGQRIPQGNVGTHRWAVFISWLKMNVVHEILSEIAPVAVTAGEREATTSTSITASGIENRITNGSEAFAYMNDNEHAHESKGQNRCKR